MLDRIWEALVRWRVYFVNITLALAFILPEVLNSPEILAIIPAQYQRWFLVAAFLVNIWMRPRAATVKSDPEVKVREAIKKAKGPATVTVQAEGETKAVIHG